MDGTGAFGWRWPRITLRPALLLLGSFVAVGVVQGSTVRLALLSEGSRLAAHVPYVQHLSGALSAWLALPLVQLAVVNAPGPRVGWLHLAACHAAGYVAFALVHITGMFGLRWIADAALGLALPARAVAPQILWEAQSDLVLYGALAVLWTLLHAWDDRRQVALEAARLELLLKSARLEALSAQLDPHFLFNALNTISAVMYEDLPATEHLLSNLGQLLRATLASSGPTWTLAEERSHAERYAELLQARFGDRLSIDFRVEPACARASVPRFALQTLIENAVKHNCDETEPLVVHVRAFRGEAELVLEVEDNGRGFDPKAKESSDRGLARLAETLRLLHGESSRLSTGCSSLPAGGARVTLRLPRGEEP